MYEGRLYNPTTCSIAYQLNWSLSVFCRSPIPQEKEWLELLCNATEPEGVRILEHRRKRLCVHQFLLSTKPEVSPSQVIRSVKGRLQHLVRAKVPKAFQRNYWMQSVGSAKRDVVEAYVSSQLHHHQASDDRVQESLERFQYMDRLVDLSLPRHSGHGLFIHNLQVVIVNWGRCENTCEEVFTTIRDTAISVSRERGHLLSRIGLFTDHIHLTLGCGVNEAPIDVGVAYLNALAEAQGGSVYQNGFYVGTFGDYDLGAIRTALSRNV